jgi:hypothetical protein
MNRRRIAWIAGIVIVLLVIFTVGTTLVLNLQPAPVPELSQVAYKQTKAVPNWDDSTRTTTDASQLSALHSVLARDGWSPGSNPDTSNGCTGGLATTLRMAFHNGTTSTLRVYQCGSKSDALTDDVTKLVSSWRGTAS